MARRPYLKHGVADLEALFQGADRGVLDALLHELGHRKTQRAQRLRSLVERTLQERRDPSQRELLRPPVSKGETPQRTSRKLVEPCPPPEATYRWEGTHASDTAVPTVPPPARTQPPSAPSPPVSFNPPPDLPVASAAGDETDPNYQAGSTKADQTLATWLALEVLSPQTFRKPEDLADGDRRRVAQFGSHPLPWRDGGEKSRPGARLFYHVVLGAVDMEKATARLLEVFADKRPERPGRKEYAALAIVTVDRDGRPVDDDFLAVSSFGWGLPIAYRNRLGDLGGWPTAERDLKRALSDALREHDADGNLQPLDRTMLSRAFANLVDSLGIDPSLVTDSMFAIRAYQWFKINTAPEPLLLNSFFIRDLALAKEKLLAEEVGDALRQYLGIMAPSQQIDVLENQEALKALVSPQRTSAGRWPTEYPLVLLQQAAVNTASQIPATGGIVAINGPPGTGKTTLLRDLVASVVVERAKALTKFQNPTEAFGHAGQMKIGQAFCHLYTLDPLLKGNEILVASSNNKAVENVSRELPGKTELASDSALRYFSTVSDEALGEPNSTWGLIAAVLGNAANRTAFRRAVWDNDDTSLKHYLAAAAGKSVPKVPGVNATTGDPEERLPAIVHAEKPPRGPTEAHEQWALAVKRFQSSLQQAEDALQQLEIGRRNVEALDSLSSARQGAQGTLDQCRKEAASAAERQTTSEELRGLKVALLDEVRSRLAVHRGSRPWFLARLFKTQRWRHWAREDSELKAEERKRRGEHEEAVRQVALETKAVTEAQENVAQATERLQRAEAQLQQCSDVVGRLREWIGENLADREFWSRAHSSLQPDTPWLAESIQRLRSNVFEEAVKVQRAFIDAAAKPIRHNLMALFSVFRGTGLGSANRDQLLPDLWSTLFLVTPVISTTFASVDRMLGKLPSEHIGWLLIDEAGQALPQAAVGAVLRSKRAIVVGDPLQIQPIVQLSPTLVNAICRDFGVDPDLWAAPSCSAQTVADRATHYGTSIEIETGSMWLGTPLLVHRRCEDPMFSLSNRIAYAGNMVTAAPERESSIRAVLGSSRWVDVQGSAQSKWSPEEGEAVLGLLKQLRHAGLANPDIFVISPFVIVSRELRKLVRDSGVLDSWTNSAWEWTQDRIGTVHTFQGKEAEAVILVLGAPRDDQRGARGWAGSRRISSTSRLPALNRLCTSSGAAKCGATTVRSFISTNSCPSCQPSSLLPGLKRLRTDVPELLEDPLDHVLPPGKERVRTSRMKITERRLIKCRGLHDTARGQLLDHHLDETDLRRRQATVVQELGESGLRGGTIETHQAADEVGQRRRVTAG